MGILVGMDEAGYGPNLGPLVVAATAWEVGEGMRNAECGIRSESAIPHSAFRTPQSDLYRPLRSVVARSPSQRRIAIADSKLLYRPGLGLRQLERGVHAVLLAMGRSISRWSALIQYCGADLDGRHQRLRWHDGFDCPLPVDTSAQELARLGGRLARACEAAGVRPLAIRARLVFPAELNELIDYFGTKGAALSHVTIGLLRHVVESWHGEASDSPPAKAGSPGVLRRPLRGARSRLNAPVFVVCDKHGGRNRYAALLQHFFPDQWIETLVEDRAESWYRWGPSQGGVDVAFRAGGEAFLPTALASMTAKYLRELAMRAFNEFWCARVPDLRPTAGYPVDARRFKAEIEAAQRALKIDDHVLWRCR